MPVQLVPALTETDISRISLKLCEELSTVRNILTPAMAGNVDEIKRVSYLLISIQKKSSVLCLWLNNQEPEAASAYHDYMIWAYGKAYQVDWQKEEE